MRLQAIVNARIGGQAQPRGAGSLRRLPGREAAAGTAKRPAAGFTLLEVLIAAAVYALVLTALYGAFFLSQKAVASVDDSLIRLQEARLFLDTLKREIEGAFYAPDREYTVFRIEDREIYGRQMSSLEATCFSPLQPGLHRVWYRTEEKDGRISVVKGLAFPPSPDRGTGFPLLDGVEALILEVRTDRGWVKSWDTALARRTPEEIRMTVVFSVGDGVDPRSLRLTETARPRIGRPL